MHAAILTRVLAFMLCTIALSACAQSRALEGQVVWVADGDSFALVDAAGERIEVRVAGIDAPEKGQAFSDRARRNLIRLIGNEEVRVDWYKLDRFDRYVGKVWVRSPDAPCRGADCPKTLDIGMAQLTQGLAWYFDRFEDELSLEDRARYADAEQEARARRIGLWRDAEPVAPWDWRDRKRRSALNSMPLPGTVAARQDLQCPVPCARGAESTLTRVRRPLPRDRGRGEDTHSLFLAEGRGLG